MKNWKRIAGCAVAFVLPTVAALAAEAGGEAGPAGAAPGGVMNFERMTELAKATASLTAKAVAQYLKLPKAKAKQFSDAYVEFAESSQKELLEAVHSRDREKMMAASRENREKMEKLLVDQLGKEQARKAEPLMGSTFGGLAPSIRVLLMNDAEKGRIEKALPLLVEHTLSQQKLIEHMRGGAVSPQDIMPRMRELNDKTTKELAKIVGEKAAQNWRDRSQIGGRPMGGGGDDAQATPQLPKGHP